jgi:hypothetical protein
VSKFGLEIGEVTLVFRKVVDADDIAAASEPSMLAYGSVSSLRASGK